MNKEFLKELGLNEDVINAVIAEAKKTTDPLQNVKDELEKEKETLAIQLNELDEKIATFNADNENLENMKQEIEQLKVISNEKDEMMSKELNDLNFNYKIDEELRKHEAKNPKAVMALLNKDNIKLEDGQLLGLTEQLTAVKHSDPYLFGAHEEPAPPAASKDYVPGSTSTGNNIKPLTKERRAAAMVERLYGKTN